MWKKRAGQKDSSLPRRFPANWGVRLPIVLGAVILGAGIIAALFVWPDQPGKTSPAYALAPESTLPAPVRRAPSKVQEAYRFAIANREVLQYIPCYCGCGAEGHTSNASCYLKDFSTPGNLVFDFMSLN